MVLLKVCRVAGFWLPGGSTPLLCSLIGLDLKQVKRALKDSPR